MLVATLRDQKLCQIGAGPKIGGLRRHTLLQFFG